MDWLSARRCADVDSAALIRNLAAFVVGFGLAVCAGLASASSVAYTFRGVNVSRVGGQTHLRGTEPTALASPPAASSSGWYYGTGALQTSGGVMVGGQAVNFQTTLALASTAAAVATTAIKASPQAMITTAIGSYLLTKGIEYADGAFKTNVPGATTAPTGQPITTGCAIQAPRTQPSMVCQQPSGMISLCRWSPPTPNSQHIDYCSGGSNFYYIPAYEANLYSPCPSGYTYQNGTCQAPATVRPTTEADWGPVAAGPFPDSAMKDVISKGVELPVNPPDHNPDYQDVPLGDPYIDPLDSKRYQEKARITPGVSDPSIADVQTFKQEINEDGTPKTDENSIPLPPAPSEQKDPCALNPERVGCAELGEVPDQELQTQERGVSSITVTSFASNATCPADVPLPKGATFSWAYPCNLATGLKPILLALAWLSAGLIVIGGIRNG